MAKRATGSTSEFQATVSDHAEFVICDHTIDITYIATDEGWLYLASILDLYSRRVIGWAMSAVMDTALVLAALQMALNDRQPPAGPLHHSEQGHQYTVTAYLV